jgi:hypothetical protein
MQSLHLARTKGTQMATISTCPGCSRLVTLPEDLAPSAAVRCPLCRAEYPLSEALASVPPLLIPVADQATESTSSPETASPLPGTAGDFLEHPAQGQEERDESPCEAGHQVEVDHEPLRSPWDLSPLSSAGQSGGDEAVALDAALLAPAFQAKRGRKRKPKSILRRMTEVELAGILGLLITYYALWWILGEACGLPRLRWLPFLPPAKSTGHDVKIDGADPHAFRKGHLQQISLAHGFLAPHPETCPTSRTC